MATQEGVAANALSTVHHYIDAFNEGDIKWMEAAFAVPGSILDGMPHTCGRVRPRLRTGTGCLDQYQEGRRIGFFRHPWDTATHGDYWGCCISCDSRDHEVQSPR
jgi:hypothetical protein